MNFKKGLKAMGFIFWLFAFTKAYSQHEYFVTVNPVTGTFATVNILPGVTIIGIGPNSCTTIDKNGGRFFFSGNDSTGQVCLYTLNVTNGVILNKVPLPETPNSNDILGQLQYDDSLQTLFGLYWQNGTENFISISGVTGQINQISTLNGVNYFAGGVYTYDQKNHTYLFECIDASIGQCIYFINALNGSITSKLSMNNAYGYTAMRFDNSSNKLLAVKSGQLFSVDENTGVNTIVTQTNYITSLPQYPSYTAMDEIHQHYIQGGDDPGGVMRLVSISTNNGNVVESPFFPVGLNHGGNVVELTYDNKSGILYALHWGYEPLLLATSAQSPTCPDSCNGAASVKALNDFAPYTYHWAQTDSNTSSIQNVCAGAYYVTVTDAYGISAADTVVVPSAATQPVAIQAGATILYQGDSTQLCATNGFKDYYWSDSANSNCIYAAKSGTYFVTATNNEGCRVSDSISILLVPDNNNLFIPNAFSPNGDGYNDVLQIYGNTYAMEYMEISVFDRIGEKVFESNKVDFTWDGSYKGKKLPPAVYVYYMDIVFLGDRAEHRTGSITLIR